MYFIGFSIFIVIILLLLNTSILVKIYRQNRKLRCIKSAGPKIVVLGGGTGQSMLLRGLKQITDNLTAVVTVADDGGGSGVLRDEMKMLPPGDIRNCIMALSEAEPEMQKIMQYRFTQGSLKQQSFGNLFLAALTGAYQDFEIAITKVSQILAVKGQVLPVTLEHVDLLATLEDGSSILGESKIAAHVLERKSKIKSIALEPKNVKTSEAVLNSIREADMIIIGPGSLYTSIIPNLLTGHVSEAIASSNAKKVYISNIMTQDGETDQMTLYQHYQALLSHSRQKKWVDMIVINKEKVPPLLLEKYAKYNSTSLYLDKEQRKLFEKDGVKVVEEDLLSFNDHLIRHDENKLAHIITYLCR